MKKILYARLHPTQTTDTEGRYCEFQYNETSEEEYGHEWNGDVAKYVQLNVDIPDDLEVSSDYFGSIHNQPKDAVIIVNAETREPVEMYWSI